MKKETKPTSIKWKVFGVIAFCAYIYGLVHKWQEYLSGNTLIKQTLTSPKIDTDAMFNLAISIFTTGILIYITRKLKSRFAKVFWSVAVIIFLISTVWEIVGFFVQKPIMVEIELVGYTLEATVIAYLVFNLVKYKYSILK